MSMDDIDITDSEIGDLERQSERAQERQDRGLSRLESLSDAIGRLHDDAMIVSDLLKRKHETREQVEQARSEVSASRQRLRDAQHRLMRNYEQHKDKTQTIDELEEMGIDTHDERALLEYEKIRLDTLSERLDRIANLIGGTEMGTEHGSRTSDRSIVTENEERPLDNGDVPDETVTDVPSPEEIQEPSEILVTDYPYESGSFTETDYDLGDLAEIVRQQRAGETVVDWEAPRVSEGLQPLMDQLHRELSEMAVFPKEPKTMDAPVHRMSGSGGTDMTGETHEDDFLNLYQSGYREAVYANGTAEDALAFEGDVARAISAWRSIYDDWDLLANYIGR